jgi:cytochrome c553
MRYPRRTVLTASFLALALAVRTIQGGQPPGPDAADVQFFEAEVRPVLVARCTECHGGEQPKGGLDLSTPAALRAAIAGIGLVQPPSGPGSTATGLLLDAIGYEDPLLAMPPDGRLPEAELATLREWVRRGAPLPESAPPVALGFDLAARRAAHWAWQPLLDPAPPVVRGPERARDPLDLFVLAALEAAGVAPAPEIQRFTWLRRVTFVLTGLPPTPSELAAFEADRAEGAFERVVDRLLASPRYGERFARHWLDLVRYAETKAHEFDYPIPNAWQYRDYVVRAFDADVPYDRFLAEHLAGDLLADDPDFGPRLDPTQRFDESILGTGWWWLSEEVHSPVDTRADEADRLASQVDTLTKAVLGLTVACARCHDHKFDAIPTEDYYGLCGFSLSTAYRQVPFEARTANAAVAREHAELARATDTARRAALAEFVRGLTAELATAAPSETGVVCLTEPIEGLVAHGATRGARSPMHWLHVAATAPAELEGLVARALESSFDPAKPPLVPVIDYGATGIPWLQDGETFGPGPRALGTVFAGDSGARARIVTRDAASADPFWRGLEPAPGAERHGGEATHVQSGRTLVTPTIALAGGYVFHLVRGRGTVQAVCNSHRMLAGPLWCESLLHFDTEGEWRYVRHGLKRLVGTHARFEFTVADDGADYGLEVAAVFDRQVDDAPRSSVDGAWLARRLEEAGAFDLVSVSDVVREVYADAATFLVVGGVPGRALADDERVGLALALDELLADVVALARPVVAESPAGATDEVAAVVDAPLRVPRGAEDMLHALDAALAPLRAAEVTLAARVVRRSALAPASLELEGRDEVVLRRGDVRSPMGPAPRRDLAAVRGDEAPFAAPGAGSGRLRLARAWTDPAHPLVARAYVNRLWHHTFGRGLVATVDDLGATGAAPSHPALLDRLARDFVAGGWSTKRLLRRFVLSDTFRRASEPSAAAREQDPMNQLLSHMPVRRLEAEAVRDSLLFVAGELDETRFGPSVPVHLTEFMQGRGRPDSSGPLDGARRRTLYQEVRRNFLAPFLAVWDFPTPSSTRGARSTSNVPAQALALSNDPFVVERARAFGARAAHAAQSVEGRVAFMLRWAFGREPRPAELAAGVEFLSLVRESEDSLADLAQALFSAQEFVWIP